jgi:hypothetical protein
VVNLLNAYIESVIAGNTSRSCGRAERRASDLVPCPEIRFKVKFCVGDRIKTCPCVRQSLIPWVMLSINLDIPIVL